MSYADRLQKLVEYQTNIRSALEAKGATISSDATLKDFPSAVDTITGDYTGPTPVDFAENGMGAYASMMSNATKIASRAFCSNQDITEANFPRVSTIGEYAFYYAQSLSNIYFPNVTSIGNQAFAYCENISIISFPKCEWLGEHAFEGCSRATTVSLPELTRGSSAGYFFANCSSLAVVNLPKYNASVTYSMFRGCINLKEASLPSLDGILGYCTFNSCYNLREVYAPLVTGVQSACFSECGTLAMLSFPNLQTIGSYAFMYETALTKLYILSDTMVKLSASNAFNASPISTSIYTGSFGSVFVKYNLLDGYKSSTNWVKYAKRIAAVVPFSAMNLNESDSITAFVDGKESPIPLEVPSTEFTYSVYSKYPKYTGTQADVDENGEINIWLPMGGVILTVNTTPEDAIVRIIEDEVAVIQTKEKFFDTGKTVSVICKALGYKNSERIVDVTEDTFIDIELEEAKIPENITAENATNYTTLVDGQDIVVQDDSIKTNIAGYYQGLALGYVTIETECDCNMQIEYSISGGDYDFGTVIITESQKDFTKESLRKPPKDCIQLVYETGELSNKKSRPVLLSPDKKYYVYVAYSIDSIGIKEASFYIHSITFEPTIV